LVTRDLGGGRKEVALYSICHLSRTKRDKRAAVIKRKEFRLLGRQGRKPNDVEARAALSQIPRRIPEKRGIPCRRRGTFLQIALPRRADGVLIPT